MKTGFLLVIGIAATIIACETENTPPVAKVYSIPEIGDSSTIFMLDGRNSSDLESSYFVLKFRWDTNADGTWDTGYSTSASYTARFSGNGYRKYTLEIADEDGGTSSVTDSVFILARKRQLDTLTDPRDKQRYPIVQIGESWWMAENLRFGNQIDVNTHLTDNGLVEFLYFKNSRDYAHYGSLYTWVEANEYPSPVVFRDICPPGWRIPTAGQWSELIKNYPQPFDIIYYFGRNSIEDLGVVMNGYYKYGDPLEPMKGEFKKDLLGVRYWTSDFTGEDSTRYFTGIHFTRDSCYLVKSFNRPDWIYHPFFPGVIIGFKSPEACYVRCVKE